MREWRLSGPIVKVVVAACCSYVALLFLEGGAYGWRENGWDGLFCFVLGYAYTQLFEYGYHRYVMHPRGRPSFIALNHLRHHAIFYGGHFASRDPESLAYVCGQWFLFPIGFVAHYLVLKPFVSGMPLAAFLGGILVHYLLFETSHWFAHVDDSYFDRALSRVPLARTWRSRQLEHHRTHHERPRTDFNFNPPYLGDRLGGSRWLASTKAVARKHPVKVTPVDAGTTRRLAHVVSRGCQ